MKLYHIGYLWPMRYKFSLYLFFLAVGLSINTHGQQYDFKTLSLNEGLSQSQVYAICEDQRGNMWFGTRGGGIDIYNGRSIRNITEEDGLLSNFINDIYEDKNGIIWIATDKGLNKYNGHQLTSFDRSNGLLGTAVYKIIEGPNEKLWLATSYGVAFLDNNIFNHITKDQGLYSNAVHDICFDHKKTLWIATERGLHSYENEQIKRYPKINRVRNNHTRSIIATDTTIWVGSYGGGVSQLINGRFINYSKSNGLKNYVILDLYLDKNNVLWIGTEGGGVVKYDGKSFQQFTSQDGLSNNAVRIIYQDSWGNMWFGTSGGGLSRLDGETFIRYNERDNLKGSGVYSITADTIGNMWFGTFGGGVTVFNKDQSIHINAYQGLTNKKVKALFTDQQGQVWIGTEGDGAFVYGNNGFTNYQYTGRDNEISGNWIKKISQDKKGRMWFATSGGGITIKDQDNYIWYNRKSGLANDRVNDFEFDKDSILWIATDDGISRKDSTGFMNYHKLPSIRVKSVEIDKYNRPWFASQGSGIYTFIGDSLVIYGQRQGLSSGNIYLLFYDANGYLWVGSEKGVDKLSIDSSGAITNIQHYGNDQGFKGIETCQNAFYQDTLGNIWFGTVNDVTRYNPKFDNGLSKAPKIQITSIRLPYEPIEKLKQNVSLKPWYNIPEDLILEYNENHITFDFIGIYLQNPTSVKYKWKLEGFEKEWSPVSDQHLVTYSNLPAGKYTFKVMAANEAGLWSAESAEFQFRINSAPPPFYRATWFVSSIVAIVLFILCLIAYIIYIRIRKRNDQIRLERNLIDLEQKALRLQMNPHFLFNCLNSIKGYISENKPQEAKIQLSKFAKLMRSILDNSREQFITIDNEVSTLKNYMDLEKLSHGDAFDYDVKLDPEIEPESMSIPTMVIQPFVENAILHGLIPKKNKGHLNISFSLEKERILCVVEDNGVGRAHTQEMKKLTVQKHKSAAIKITQERLKLFSRNKNDNELKINIIDLTDNNGVAIGTKVEIRMPIF